MGKENNLFCLPTTCEKTQYTFMGILKKNIFLGGEGGGSEIIFAKIDYSVHTYAPIFELPSNITDMI